MSMSITINFQIMSLTGWEVWNIYLAQSPKKSKVHWHILDTLHCFVCCVLAIEMSFADYNESCGCQCCCPVFMVPRSAYTAVTGLWHCDRFLSQPRHLYPAVLCTLTQPPPPVYQRSDSQTRSSVTMISRTQEYFHIRGHFVWRNWQQSTKRNYWSKPTLKL